MKENFGYFTLDGHLKDGFEIKAAYNDGDTHYILVQRDLSVRLLSYNLVDTATGVDGWPYPQVKAMGLS